MSDKFDPEKIYKGLVEAGNDWADKEAAANLLEQTKKTYLAQLQTQHFPTDSATGGEQKALARPEYKDHITAMVNARKEANKAQVKYYSMRTLASLRQSEAANARIENQMSNLTT